MISMHRINMVQTLWCFNLII